MKIELGEIGRVKPYEANPRKNEGAVKAVARGIEEFGFRVPLVVSIDGFSEIASKDFVAGDDSAPRRHTGWSDLPGPA